ncbi:MAG: cobalamin B12-binding domain-containing protein [Pseudomonadota bacterium]
MQDVPKSTLSEKTATAIDDVFGALRSEALNTVAKEALHRIIRKSETMDRVFEDAADDGAVDQLCAALLAAEPHAGEVYVDRLRERGASLEMMHLGYFAPAARRLGALWDEDEVGFIEVTRASLRLYALIRGLNRDIRRGDGDAGRRAIFTATPGETHILGVTSMKGLLEERGWAVDLVNDIDHDALVDLIVGARDEVSIVGLSAGSERVLPELGRLIVALHLEAPEVRIVVGGRVLDTARAEVLAMRPDGLSEDLDQTYEMMERLARARASVGSVVADKAKALLPATGLLAAFSVTAEV